ncbi:MAG: peptidase M24 [Betaproteobacteria bacterium RIFCSPLOWO2_12_FULL_63_13]|nr:MAG: peptidase M24 [Betaproteobacteria bacterium RIFCSPLOWO2_12_FULL_63_13]
MKYNRPHATAAWGTMAKDWELGVDYARLIRERFQRAQASVKSSGLGAVLCFNVDNVRYVTGTHIGEWVRDKFDRYALCPREGEPYLWDPAPPAKRISSPWIADRVAAPVSTMQGALPPNMRVQDDFARQIRKKLADYGVDKQPLGVDLVELPMLRALEKEGIEVVDGQQAMLDAREVKTADEIELLKVAAGMVDATYVDIARAIRPGTRENELVAIAHDRLFRLGSERVECVNSVAGPRGKPHSHTFSDRIIQPGDMVFLDIMHSYNGYHTCYYRTFICGQPNKYQIEAYELCSKWVSASIDAIRPGVSVDEVASVWPEAAEFGYKDEEEAFLLQYGHGIGLSLWERPIITRRFRGQNTVLKEGMVFAVECWKGAEDGSGAARIEEEVVVTRDGCQVITNFPSDHLISCGLPGCEVF